MKYRTLLVTPVLLILWVHSITAQSGEEGSSPEQLHLSPDQPNQNQPVGASFAVFCNKGVGDGAYSDFKWIGPQGQEITHNNSANIYAFESENGLALNFDAPKPENSGRYICKALYGGTSQLEVSVKISFFHDITFDDCLPSQSLVLGREGIVQCLVHGNPVPTVRWTKLPDLQFPSEKFTIKGSNLHIRNVSDADAGNYRITAMVEATGKIRRQLIRVNVITPPTIVNLPEVSPIIEGHQGWITCTVKGVPPPLCYWTDFRGRNLSDVSGFRVTPETCQLEFVHSSREHEGSYMCHALNPAGGAVQETRVEVAVAPKVLDFQNQTVDEKGTVTLECRVEGKPEPIVQIRKEQTDGPLGQNIGDEGYVSLETISSNNTEYITTLRATISPVHTHNAGLYYCSAENSVSRVERTGQLNVNFAPVLTAKENPVYTWANRPATLTCNVQAIPNATVEWRYEDGTMLEDSSIYTIDSSVGVSVLTINGRDERYDRDFICTALNNLGERSLVFNVREARRPDSPSLPRIQRVTATTITFEFNRLVNNGGMPILEYLIRYRRQGQRTDEAEVKSFAEVVGKPLTITKLLPRTQYIFGFSARSEVGEGPSSQELTVDTIGEAVPDRPVFINPPHADVHPSRVHIEWTMPLDNGKRIDHFLVSYQLAEQISATEFRDTGRKRLDKVSSWSSMVSKDLLDLAPNMFYRVRVQAHNELGYGDPAELVFRTGAAIGMIGLYPNEDEVHASAMISTPVIIAFAVLLAFLLLILVDVLCYFQFRKGLLYALRHLVCSKPKHIYTKTSQNSVA